MEIPPAPAPDPATAVMSDPKVPENRRFCSDCDAPVGRSRNDKPGLEEGFCPQCRTLFSFEPKLKPGDLLGGQYEVAGCLAHGGMGWVYLARDRNVSDRWVVLKGLLNAGDRCAGRAGRAALPGRGRAPEHRQDLRLRPAMPPATSSWSTSAGEG